MYMIFIGDMDLPLQQHQCSHISQQLLVVHHSCHPNQRKQIPVSYQHITWCAIWYMTYIYSHLTLVLLLFIVCLLQIKKIMLDFVIGIVVMTVDFWHCSHSNVNAWSWPSFFTYNVIKVIHDIQVQCSISTCAFETILHHQMKPKWTSVSGLVHVTVCLYFMLASYHWIFFFVLWKIDFKLKKSSLSIYIFPWS